ncbi:hypothetical protein PybrP1_004420 [[Pythium] brassicae (nom. inval.)]|nr:hypothetical protein PybrP1_004420 [[Pythium] brassicae (nom. inval.)]
MSTSVGTSTLSGREGGVYKGRRAVDSCRDEFTLVAEGEKHKMQCNHCGVIISNHTVTLKNHLARKHGAVATGAAATATAAATTAGASGPHHHHSASSDESKSEVLRKRPQHSSSHSGDDTESTPPQRSAASNGDKKRRLKAETGQEEKAEEEEEEATENDAASDAGDGAETEEEAPLLDRQEFADMNREMHEHDEMREQIIKRSREILKSSKQAIFALHRNDNTGAAALLANAETVIAELAELAKADKSLRDGALAAALEEYVEAKAFSYYLTDHRLLPLRDLPHVQSTEYIGGVIDFTGELMRFAVAKATARDTAEVKRCRAMVEAIAGELLQFDFRNGPLRKKYDAVKYNLRKLENTLYELSLITASGLAIRSDAAQDDSPKDASVSPM